MLINKIPIITVTELKQRIDNNDDLLMIDIRKPREWVETGVIEGSHLITDERVIKDIDFGDFASKLAGKEVIFICRSGNRSGRMTSFLLNHRKIDAKAIINMKGGILEWKRNGFPVIDPVS